MGKNELVVLTGLDFNDLNQSIEILGDRNKTLTDKEKEIGVGLLSDWQRNVLDKISNKREEVDKIRRLLLNGDAYFNEKEEKRRAQEKLAELAGAQKLYKGYLALEDSIEQYSLTKPQRLTIDPNKTVAQNDLEYADFERELRKFEIEKSKLEYTKNQAYNRFLAAVRKSPKIKTLVKQIDDYMLKLKRYEAEAKDKANLAKVNLSISDAKVREAIQSIIDFTKSIN